MENEKDEADPIRFTRDEVKGVIRNTFLKLRVSFPSYQGMVREVLDELEKEENPVDLRFRINAKIESLESHLNDPGDWSLSTGERHNFNGWVDSLRWVLQELEK